jgi:hypothetical protein
LLANFLMLNILCNESCENNIGETKIVAIIGLHIMVKISSGYY